MSLLMKPWPSVFSWLLLVVAGVLPVPAIVLEAPSPISRVLKMLDGMKQKVAEQGSLEQASHDKFSQWGEETVVSTNRDIAHAKAKIDDLQAEILKLKGSLGAGEVTIAQLKKDVDENMQAQKEAESVRQQDLATYENDKAEAEQCIAALEAAAKALSGKAGKFLQNGAMTPEVRSTGAFHEAQLMGAAAELRGVLQKSLTSHLVSENDLRTMRQFVDNPASAMSTAQIGQGQNPYGDFAPQSTQIQGVLKGLHDAFVEKLNKCNTDEASAAKAFDSLMVTKKKEAQTLQTSLDKQELDSAEDAKDLADKKEELDATKTDLEGDKRMLQETEATIKEKEKDWSESSKLRDMELTSIEKAIEILTSKDAAQTFEESSVSFVQVSLNRRSASPSAFDKVLIMIDGMIANLRKEEQEDIEHRDRCKRAEDKNRNEKEDLAHAKTSTKQALEQLKQMREASMQTLSEVEADIQDVKKIMDDSLQNRNEEHEEFLKSMKADTEAVVLITEAQTALSKFYKRPSSFLDTSSLVSLGDKKPAKPQTGSSVEKKREGKYEAQKALSKGVITALDIIKEDLRRTIAVNKREEEQSQQSYEHGAAMMEKTVRVKKDKKHIIKKELAELGEKLEDKQATLSENSQDAAEAEDMTSALVTDCLWVKSHFDTRRKKRKAEIEGLQQAKINLSNAGEGMEDDSLDLN